MNIKTIAAILTIASQSLLNAQVSVKVTYEQQNIYPDNYWEKIPQDFRENTKKLLTQPITLNLINNGEASLIVSEDKKLNFSSMQENNPDERNLGINMKLAEVWTHNDFNTNTTTKKVKLDNKSYYRQSPFDNTTYEFDPTVTKKIDSYQCNLAYYVSKKSNDTIKYWYAKEIAIADGPYGPSSIPGLILRYENKYRVIYATKIEYADSKLKIKPLDNKIPILSNDEYLQAEAESRKPKNYVDEDGMRIKKNSVIIK